MHAGYAEPFSDAPYHANGEAADQDELKARLPLDGLQGRPR
jgi:hypothetical protein